MHQQHKEIIETLELLQKCALDEIIKADNVADRSYMLGRAIGFKLAIRVIESEDTL